MLVSAIMPTRGRRYLVQTAVQCFLSQDWTDKELLILDDFDDPSFPGAGDQWGQWEIAGVRYFRMPKMTIGRKREKLCELAQGEVIIHFDSDDWSAPGRITEQVELLESSGKPLCGYHSLLFWDQQHTTGYLWHGTQGFVVGTSMCYTREFWKSHHWPEYSGLPHRPRVDATDTEIVNRAMQEGLTATLPGRGMCIARAHGSNTSNARHITTTGWPKVQDTAFPPAFFAALELEILRAA